MLSRAGRGRPESTAPPVRWAASPSVARPRRAPSVQQACMQRGQGIPRACRVPQASSRCTLAGCGARGARLGTFNRSAAPRGVTFAQWVRRRFQWARWRVVRAISRLVARGSCAVPGGGREVRGQFARLARRAALQAAVPAGERVIAARLTARVLCVRMASINCCRARVPADIVLAQRHWSTCSALPRPNRTTRP